MLANMRNIKQRTRELENGSYGRFDDQTRRDDYKSYVTKYEYIIRDEIYIDTDTNRRQVWQIGTGFYLTHAKYVKQGTPVLIFNSPVCHCMLAQ